MASYSIQERFAIQAARTPDATAVSAGSDIRVTYRELDERANRLAHRLHGMGVGPEQPVAVLMERSPELVVATLAVLKAGAFYVPLHYTHPLERMQWIIDGVGSAVLLTDEATRGRGLPRADQVVVAGSDPALAAMPTSDPGVRAHPNQLAYVMYTSGSTGLPKGVAVTHRDALGLALDQCWDQGRHERVLMVAPYAFGMSTFELWVPLLHGGEIILAPHGDLEVATLRRLILEKQITTVHLTAGLFRVVAEEAPESLATVREVMTGGDVISPKAVERVLHACPTTVVRAMYGSTETTLFATNGQITAPYRAGATVPVGRPMDDMRVYILDDGLRSVPPDVVGEMYIAGTGVVRGYFGRPDLTAERFVPDPFNGTGERMYRTGDLARWTADGLVDFVGRADDQVKIRGFRVELAEVEAVLAAYPGIAHAAVAARDIEPGDKRLAAYVVPGSAELDTSALRAHATDLLPDYMVPAAFTVLDALPLTANGKLDRRALPAPDFEAASAYRAPRTTTQEAVCSIFADVLGVPKVGIDDSFFDLYGQSMQAMRVMLRIESELGTKLPIAELYDSATPALLAEQIDRQRAST